MIKLLVISLPETGEMLITGGEVSDFEAFSSAFLALFI
jgi:hypothetical protein